jgi:hypothetical protein
MSPIRDAEERRRYNREWMAKRRAEFFADETCADCGSHEHLELDGSDCSDPVNHRVWSWSTSRRAAELAKYAVRCSSCRVQRLGAKQTRHGTRGRYEKGCRCDACKQAKSDRNARYREQHQSELAAKQAARPNKPRAPRTASGVVGVYHVPSASKSKPWRAQIGVNKRLVHLGMFATKGEAAAARVAAERDLAGS